MRIEAAELRILELPLKFRFETSFGVQTKRTILLLRLFGEGLEGLGEGVMERLPLYREETVAGARYLLEEVFLPRVLGRDLPNPEALREALLGRVGGAAPTAVRPGVAPLRPRDGLAEGEALPEDLMGLALEEAARALALLTGKEVAEEVVARVFQNFCVGK